MASKIVELLHDFKFKNTVYTEKLPITEKLFLRLLTRGVQQFQRDVLYVEKWQTITYSDDGSGNFAHRVPYDFWQPILLKDSAGASLVMQDYSQFQRNVEHSGRGYLETPVDYSLRNSGGVPWPSGKDMSRIWTVFNRQIITFPNVGSADLLLYYIPELHAYSSGSPQWSSWNVSEAAFLNLFNTARLHDNLSQYEKSFVDYACMEYRMACSAPDWVVFDRLFKEAVENAKVYKPTFTSEAVLDYFFAPNV